MQEQRFKEMDAQLDRMAGPVQRMTTLTLDSFERLSDFQLRSMQSYSKIALQQWRDMLAIEDDRGLRSFLDRQQNVAEQIGRMMGEDAQQLARIGQELIEQAQRVAEHNLRSMAQATETAVEGLRERTDAAAERTGSRDTRRAS